MGGRVFENLPYAVTRHDGDLIQRNVHRHLHSQEAENQAAAVEARQGEVQVISTRLVSRELKILSVRVSKAPPIQSVQEQAGGKTRM